MSNPADRDQFEDLLGRLFDDDIDTAQLCELTTLVRENSEYSDELGEHLKMASRLAQHENEDASADNFVRSLEAALDAERDGDEFVDKVVQLADQEAASASIPTRRPWVVAAISLAACLTVALVMLGREWWAGKGDPPDYGVAVISSLAGELSGENRDRVTGDTVVPGMLQLDSGYLALEFYHGARMTVAGPARLELINEERVVCHYGKIRAHVPVVARGFVVVTPESEFVDLGTEFAVEVGQKGETEIHVFAGEVEAFDSQRSPESKKLLTEGRAMKVSDGTEFSAQAARFEKLVAVDAMEQGAADARYDRWKAISEAATKDERLIAYYDFEPNPAQKRSLINRSKNGSDLDGAIVGARWGDGPWPGKAALNFKRPGDRVRIHLPGEYEAITLAAWVRIDALDRDQSSLLRTDGYDLGEVHWQVQRKGGLVIGLRHSESRDEDYPSSKVVDVRHLGRWFHLATVVDPETEQVAHYVNGVLDKRLELSGATTIRFGDVSIGNWDESLGNTDEIISNLNGQIAEVMVFGVALDEEEIRLLALEPGP